MKKILATITMAALLTVVLPLAASAQTSRNHFREDSNHHSRRHKEEKNIYEKHRNVFNLAIATGAGALLGALFGGKKGALIGAGIGAGAGALYTYKIDPKDEKNPRNKRWPRRNRTKDQYRQQ